MCDTRQCLKYIDNSKVKVFCLRQVEKNPFDSVALKILDKQTEANARVVYKLD